MRKVICIFFAGALLSGSSHAQSGGSKGTWTTNASWPIFGIHAIMMPNKEVLIFNRGRFQPYFPVNQKTLFKTGIVAPPYTNCTEIPFWDNQEHTPHEIFCSGHTLTSDGKVFFAGGHIADNVGTFDTHTYDPATRQFTLGPDMKERRWYPTCVLMPNRRIAIFSGTYTNQPGIDKRNPFVELWMDNVGPTFTSNHLTDIPSAQRNTDRYYPFIFIDPKDGNLVFCANGVVSDGYGTAQHFVEPNAKLNTLTWTWSNYISQPNTVQNVRLDYPSAAMMNGVIYKSGGSKLGDINDPDHYATKRTLKVDLKLANPAWTAAPDMVMARKHHTLTALPDGHLIAMGGTLYGQYGQVGGPETNDFTDNQRSAPEWLDTTATTPFWTLLAKPTPDIGRGYHSTAVLLPDARILVTGGENEYQVTVTGQPPITAQKRTAQIFSPPYGGNNSWMQVRPRLMTSAGSASQPAPTPVLFYENRFTMAVRPSVGRQIRKVSLISLASVTHAFNENQTFVWLPVVSTGPLTTQVQLPANENIAPPGYYMMFAVDDAGIPSEGLMVKLSAGTFRSPTLTAVYAGYDAVTDPSELYAGDNIYLGGSGGLSSSGQNSLTVDMETTACAGKFGVIEVNGEARMSRPGTRTRQLWNWLTEEWVTVGTTSITTQDSLASHEINVGTDFGEFMNARDRRVRARMIFTSDAPFNLWMDMVEFGFR